MNCPLPFVIIKLYITESGEIMNECETCAYYEYDEEDESYYCSVNMDEDDYARLYGAGFKGCRYYRSDDEYAVVKRQI